MPASKANSTSFKARALVDSYSVDPESGCWVWSGAVNASGYGSKALGGTSTTAHRWVWERTVGPIGDGMQLDHLCRNRLCVNPEHMEPVTPTENNRRRPKYDTNNAKAWETKRKTLRFSSRFAGVSAHGNRWVARISSKVTIGSSATEEGAEYCMRLYRKEVPLAPL